jgi:hypothetical protein
MLPHLLPQPRTEACFPADLHKPISLRLQR